MNSHEALAEFPWNEAELGRASPLNEGLVSIIAFTTEGQPRPAGSGFLISSDGQYAVGLTAAHVFDGIASLHSRRPYRNDHLVPAPLRQQDELDLNPARLMALTFLPGEPPVCAPCTFMDVSWDSTTDVAFFRLKLPGPCTAPPAVVQIAGDVPAKGEVVAMLGYADSEGESRAAPEIGTEGRAITIKQRLVMRAGRVIAHHDSHLWCRGPCIETTIPIFSGMSGCLVAPYVEGQPVKAFGVASHDLEPADASEKCNRAIAGSSIVALLGVQVHPVDVRTNAVLLTLANGKFRSCV